MMILLLTKVSPTLGLAQHQNALSASLGDDGLGSHDDPDGTITVGWIGRLMTEESTPINRADGNDLRTVIPRLVDLQRKCRSVGTKNAEAVDMEARIESILKRLQPEPATDPEAENEPIPFAALARELFAVERFFESNGFLSMAKEVAYVERTLESFAPADQLGASQQKSALDLPVSGTDTGSHNEEDTTETDTGPSKWAVPKPLAVVGLLSLIAIAVCIAIIVRHQTAAGAAGEPVRPQPTPNPTVSPPRPTATPRSVATAATPAPGAILAEAIGKARLALAEGDIDGAIDHLSEAALVDSDHATVLGTANQIVELLVDRANAAVDGGLWEIANLTLVRAERIATRFGLDTHRIDEAKRRHALMDHFSLVQPGETDTIRTSAGKRVTIYFKDGSERDSIIKGAQGGQLLLDQDTTVRGGAVYYTEKVPLGEIDYLKVWDE